MSLDRRRDITGSVALAVAAACARRGAALAGPGPAPGHGNASPRALTLYDPRFPHALPRALRMAAGGPLLAVQGDSTALLGLTATHRMQGVTTEAIPFCLSAGRDVTAARIDRDLFEWTL